MPQKFCSSEQEGQSEVLLRLEPAHRQIWACLTRIGPWAEFQPSPYLFSPQDVTMTPHPQGLRTISLQRHCGHQPGPAQDHRENRAQGIWRRPQIPGARLVLFRSRGHRELFSSSKWLCVLRGKSPQCQVHEHFPFLSTDLHESTRVTFFRWSKISDDLKSFM